MEKVVQINSTKQFVMKCSLILMFWLTCTGILVAGTVHSQNLDEVKVNLSLKQSSLKEGLIQLQEKSHIRFVFVNQLLEQETKVLNLKNTRLSVAAALQYLLAGTQLRYRLVNEFVVIEAKPIPPKKSSLKGRVVEFGTSEPMPGASVYILELAKGTSSDTRGFYQLDGIMPGKYTLQVSYIGFTTERFRIEIKEGTELTFDIKLKASNALNEVVVTRKKGFSKSSVAHTSDKELLADIRNATGVVSGISNELISKTADRNAAEVVKKISGVTVVDERFIVVRGMNERYNLTYLNDNVAPSTELYNKAFAYDLLPSSSIDKILVYKSPVADLVADYAGAAVKVFTKDAVSARHIDVGLQVAHRPGSTFATINSYTGGKFDFLGFDDGSRKLPDILPSYFQDAQPSQQALVRSMSTTLDYGQKKSIADLQFFGNYYDSFSLGGKTRLYNLTTLNYSHETRFYDVYRQTGNTGKYMIDTANHAGNSNNSGDLNRITQSQQTTEIGKVNILENLTLKLNEHHQFKFKNFFVNEGRSLTTVNQGRPNYTPLWDETTRYHRSLDVILSFQQRLLYSGNLGGMHTFGRKDRNKLEWNLGYTYDFQDVPDQRISKFASVKDQNGQSGQLVSVGVMNPMIGMITRVFVKNQENLYNASADYTFAISPGLSLKAGTYHLFKSRNVGRRVFRVNRGGLGIGPGDFMDEKNNPIPFEYGYGLSDPNLINFRYSDLAGLWNERNFPSNGSGLQIYDATAMSDSYLASEENHSFYGMGDWKTFDHKLTMNAGLRVEYDRQKVAGAGLFNSIPYSIPVDHPKTLLLPSVNISYRPDSAYVIRAGYGRTLNRPEFREITPYDDFDYQNNELIRGNPAVVTASIENFDLRAEFYPKSSLQNETFNIGVFYKRITNPIEKLRLDQDASFTNSYTQISFGNAVSAKVYGIELELKKNLSFFGGGLFRNLSLLVNGAIIKSSTVQHDLSMNLYEGNEPPIPGRPLQGQSPYVINTGLFYENPGWGTKMGFTYNISGPRIYAKSLVNFNSKNQAKDPLAQLVARPDLLELPRQLLDFSITQRIIRSLQVKASVQNLLNKAFRIVEDQNYDQHYNKEEPFVGDKDQVFYKGDNIYNQYNPGRYFLFQFTYAF